MYNCMCLVGAFILLSLSWPQVECLSLQHHQIWLKLNSCIGHALSFSAVLLLLFCFCFCKTVSGHIPSQKNTYCFDCYNTKSSYPRNNTICCVALNAEVHLSVCTEWLPFEASHFEHQPLKVVSSACRWKSISLECWVALLFPRTYVSKGQINRNRIDMLVEPCVWC